MEFGGRALARPKFLGPFGIKEKIDVKCGTHLHLREEGITHNGILFASGRASAASIGTSAVKGREFISRRGRHRLHDSFRQRFRRIRRLQLAGRGLVGRGNAVHRPPVHLLIPSSGTCSL